MQYILTIYPNIYIPHIMYIVKHECFLARIWNNVLPDPLCNSGVMSLKYVVFGYITNLTKKQILYLSII